MGDIYSMATLNIGATAAAEAKSSNLGLSVNARATGYFTPARLRFERRDFSGDYIIYSDDMFGTIYRTALMRRGWVLQERMLSPRSVYFGDIFTWECTELLATEVFPGGVPHNESLRWGFNRPLRLQAMLQTDVTQESTYRRWLDIAMSYSECRLGFPRSIERPVCSWFVRRRYYLGAPVVSYPIRECVGCSGREDAPSAVSW
jgi:hypothetical protein